MFLPKCKLFGAKSKNFIVVSRIFETLFRDSVMTSMLFAAKSRLSAAEKQDMGQGDHKCGDEYGENDRYDDGYGYHQDEWYDDNGYDEDDRSGEDGGYREEVYHLHQDEACENHSEPEAKHDL
jgi:hypothetical protein